MLSTKKLFTGTLPVLKDRHFNVAYLTPEILFSRKVKSGSGGLGVVAGSFMQELEQNHEYHGHSALAISFYCSYGYQRQIVRDISGGTMDITYEKDRFPEATEDTGIRIKLIFAGRPCIVAVRMPCNQAREHTAIALLDTDIPENPADFRMITKVLYGEKHATAFFDKNNKSWFGIDWLRILQAAVLGLGSYYLMKQLNTTCDVTHLNESHPVFFLIHQIGLEQEAGNSFEQALENVRRKAVFTNHTILDSGNKYYPYREIIGACGHYAGFDYDTLKRVDPSHGQYFSMTDTALHLVGPGHTNGVSIHHADIANKKWPGYNIIPITNGIYSSYQHPEFRALNKPEQIPDLKKHLKAELYRNLCQRAREAGYNITTSEQAILESVFVIWARRCQEYKRSGLMWHDPEQSLVKKLLEWGWISIAWGGFVHPDDTAMVDKWNHYWRKFRVLPNTIPIFNYDLELMRPLLKAGSQVWLNNPLYGYEACGTSGFSAILNCSIVVSMEDGGMREVSNYIKFGSNTPGNKDEQYVTDARELWQAILPSVIKLRENDPAILNLLFNAKLEAEEKFSATRMVKDYFKELYRL